MKAWLAAARPATLWAAVVPVLVGGGLAWGDGCEDIQCITTPCPEGECVFRWDAFLVTLLAAIAIQIATNFANDASDAKRGADAPGRIGPTRAVAAGLISARQMWAGVWVMFAIAAACGIYLAMIAGWVIILIGIASVVAALGYVGGPKPYGYRGLGELFVFLFFGVVATVGSRFVHDSTAPAAAWLLSIPVGLLAAAILTANNIRDIDTDAAAGKRTLAVILGRDGARRLYTTELTVAFALIAVFAATGATPGWTALGVAAAPLAMPLISAINREVEGPPLIGALKGTARLHLVTGILVAAGAALS